MRRGLAPSREQAQLVIAAGRVTVAGAPAPKASRLVAAGEAVEVLGSPPRFVGRGGEKLDAALDRFAVDARGRRVIDAGASTGGFTDCLLQRGAREVVAVDVGHGQLDARIRRDARVTVMERTNVRRLDATRVTPSDYSGAARNGLGTTIVPCRRERHIGDVRGACAFL